MARGVGGEGGARGGRDPNAGGRSGGRGGGTGNAGERGTLSQQQDRRNTEAARRAGNSAPGVRGAGGGSFVGGTGLTRDKMRTQDQIGANVSKALNDQRGVGDSFLDRIGNMIAGAFGFNEMDPTRPGYSAPGRPGMTGKADWGFDPVGLAGGLAGSAFGIPGLGFVTDQLSSLAGRPLEINMGPSVFGGMPFGGGPLSPGQGGGQMAGNTGNYGGVLSPQPRTPNSAPQVASQPQQGSPMPSYGSWQQPMQWAQPGMSGLSSWGVQPTQPMFGQPLWSPTGQQQWGQRQPRTHTTGWR